MLAGAGTNDGRWAAPTCKPPNAEQLLGRYSGLEGQFSYPINTASPIAQRLFELVGWQAYTSCPEGFQAVRTLACHDCRSCDSLENHRDACLPAIWL